MRRTRKNCASLSLMGRSSSTSTSRLPAANNAKATSTKVSSPVSNPASKPASSTTAKTVTASCPSEVARSYFKEGVDVRSARIQDALREGQELIVQVEKEERGNKGAAPDHVHLAGRPLSGPDAQQPRGGGVSRRVEGEDRQELRDTMEQLELPQGMSIIARTAGIGRNVEELQWDLSTAAALDGDRRRGARQFRAHPDLSRVQPGHPRHPRLFLPGNR